MPRRPRNPLHVPIPRRSHKAPPTLNVRKPKVDPSGLAECYEWMPYGVDLSMALALGWYEVNTPNLLFQNPLGQASMNTYSKAEKAFRLGTSTDQPGEREQSYRTALRLYEKVFADKHQLPKLQEDNKPTPSRRVTAMASTLTTLNSAYGTLGIKFIPSHKKEREFISGNVYVPLTQLAEMSNSALMGAAFGEFLSVVKAASLVPDVDNPGNLKLDGGKLLNESIPKALNGLLQWAEQQPAKLLFKQRVVTTGMKHTAAATGPRAPRTKQPKLLGTIHLTGRSCTMKGKRLAVFQLIKNGMSTNDYQSLVDQHFANDNTWGAARTAGMLQVLVQAGLIIIA